MRRGLNILLLILLAMPMFGRQRSYTADNGHYVGFYLEGAYSRIAPWNANVVIQNGYGTSAGLLYEYENGSFIFDLGCGFTWQTGGWALPDMISYSTSDVVDTQGKTYTLQTQLEREDVIRRGYICVPIMFGGTFGRMYMLGGIKAGIGVVNRSQMRATISTYAEYSRYFGPIHDASNHALRTAVPVTQRYTMDSDLDVKLSYEVGLWLTNNTHSSTDFKARLALFADYGIFASQYQQNSEYIDYRPGNYDFSTYQLLPILVSGKDTFLGNLLAGIKITLLVGGGDQARRSCLNCRMLW